MKRSRRGSGRDADVVCSPGNRKVEHLAVVEQDAGEGAGADAGESPVVRAAAAAESAATAIDGEAGHEHRVARGDGVEAELLAGRLEQPTRHPGKGTRRVV